MCFRGLIPQLRAQAQRSWPSGAPSPPQWGLWGWLTSATIPYLNLQITKALKTQFFVIILAADVALFVVLYPNWYECSYILLQEY